MKKLILAITLLMSGASFAQINQYEALKAIPEGTLFKGYHNVGKNSDGKVTAGTYDYKFKIEHHNSMFGKLYAMKMNKEDNEKEAYDFRGPATNHYTEPSIIGGNKSRGYVIIGNVVYYVDKINDWKNPTSFRADKMYVMVPQKEEGKKLTMKEKIAAAKAAMSYPKEITDVDHKAVLTEYFAAMAEKQKAPLSATDQKELDAIIQAEDNRVAGINAKNDAYWASEEGQAMKKRMQENSGNNKADIILINNTGSDVCLVNHSATTVLLKGAKKEYWCSDIHYGTWDGSDCKFPRKSQIASDNDCGRTITLGN